MQEVSWAQFMEACDLFKEETGITVSFCANGEYFGSGWDYDEQEGRKLLMEFVGALNRKLVPNRCEG